MPVALVDRRKFLALLAAAPACRAASPTPPNQVDPDRPLPGRAHRHADLVVQGGTLLTQDPAQPTVAAIAIADGVIVECGSEADCKPWIGERTRVVDLAGGLGTPGLIDAHAHLVGLGHSLATVDLRGSKSIDEVVARVREQAPATGWIIGRAWDQNLWPGGEMPTHHPLTQAFPDRVVWLRRVDGHAGWGNAALLKEAGIGPRTPSPAGGEIVRDAGGVPTGVLVDAAMNTVRPPAPTATQLEGFIRAGQQHAAERGLTGVHEMGIGPDEDAAYRRLASKRDPESGLGIRVHAYAAEQWFSDALTDRTRDPIFADAMYALAGVKVYADGALGSRGAALLQPYADRHDHSGLMQHDEASLARVVSQAFEAGWQVATHAIGDRANRAVLDAYEKAASKAARSDLRHRIEHCQIVDPKDIPRFAELGVIASMQPTHATSDMSWVPDRLGAQRLAGAYAWRRFLDEGAVLCLGSDFPVELVDVTHGLYAAVTRADAEGSPANGWLPEQRLTLLEAIAGFSSAAAYASHREEHLGRLAPGYRGDVTCFAADLRDLQPAALRDAKVTATLVEGRVVFEA